jgi:hypothetical protein
MPRSFSYYFILSFFFAVACSTGKCREQRKTEPNPAVSPATTTDIPAASPMATKTPAATVKVFKYDGSKQCEKSAGTDLETMAKQLGSIKIISQKKTSDGRMRIQMCGSDTGQINLYEISSSDLDAALKSGFKEWKH